MPETKPYGSWKSPITSKMLVEKSLRLRDLYRENDTLYWTEGRPEEQGRVAIVKFKEGKTEDLLPTPYNARTTVNEYGGSALAIYKETVYFSNFEDQRIYALKSGETPTPVTEEGPYRYADFIIDKTGTSLYCVREDHSTQEPTHTIVKIDLNGEGTQEIIVQGDDFYANPRLSPDGTTLAWISWNHPNMPWDGTELWTLNLTTGENHKVSGGSEIAIYQPEWSPEGILHYMSDKTGWWNLYKSTNGKEVALFPIDAECGMPLWIFGMRNYDFLGKQIALTYTHQGISHIGLLDPNTHDFNEITTPFTTIRNPIVLEDNILFLGDAPTIPSSFICLNTREKRWVTLHKSQNVALDSKDISLPVNITFPTQNGEEAYAWYYPPHNPDYKGPEGELPPLIVHSHGGPTAQSTNSLKLGVQYWTSRGFAFLDVNYSGSTGCGREYRNRLYNNFGVLDLEDCCNAAQYLVKKQLADPKRLAISGGSSGGYTTLCALTFGNTFKAGASYFGISDLEALALHTHKFESRYLDKIVAPYPEQKDVYIARSPIHHTDKLSCPIILLQGLEDKVVPPSQSVAMYNALKEKGIPTAYIPFEKEQHGFRISENIIKSIQAEFYFYSQIFEFTPADQLEPIKIDGLVGDLKP